MTPSPSTRSADRALCVLAAVTVVLLPVPAAHAQDVPSLFEMSLEQLVNLEVTTVSRRSERLAETTSAVYVVTRDDILRYGVSSVPEALRLVPGLSVLQIDGNKWAIGSRGFTGRFANKLLVLMDGRVLYTPSFSGVFWDVQDTLLEDIARIEVIRGPGSAIWGTNAVNGVINIITRSAKDDPGIALSTRVESGGGRTVAARFGAAPSESYQYRTFLKYQEQPSNRDEAGRGLFDEWRTARAGARFDWAPTSADSVFFSGEIYDGAMGNSWQLATLAPPYVTTVQADADVSGLFGVGSWVHNHADGATSTVQMTADSTDRASAQFAEERRTLSFDVQHQRAYARHELVVGAEYRANSFDIRGSETVSIGLSDERQSSLSAFVQDQFVLVPDRLRLTLGAKLERNELSNRDVDFMPSARLLWQVSPATTVWAAVTRAVRTPSYADLSARVLDVDPVMPPGSGANPFPLPLRPSAIGSPAFVSEQLLAYEMGLRGRIGNATSFDLAVYSMDYDQLRAYVPVGAYCAPSGLSVVTDPQCLLTATSVLTEIQFNNAGAGKVSGFELTLTWDISDRWRMHGSYAYADERQHADPPNIASTPATGPKNQAMIRSEWSLGRGLSLSGWLRYVDEIPSAAVEDYWQANLQLGWRVNERWQLSVGGRNLLDDAKLEFRSELNDVVATEIERRFFVRAEWSF